MQSIARWEAAGAPRPIRGRRLFVVDRGPRTDPAPLVLIHGYPTSSWDFAPILDRLPPERRAITFDLLGFGLSEKPFPHTYTLFEQADLVTALLADLQLPRLHLVAHDMGDTVVQELLARALDGMALPFTILSVTLLNGGVLVDRVHPILSQRILRTAPARRLLPLLPRALARRAFDASMRRIAGRPPTVEELDGQFALSERNDGRRLLPLLIGYMRERELHARRWRRSLLTHPYPMQLLWGDRDPINPWSTAQYIAEEHPNTRARRLENIGHYPQIEAPHQVALSILEFTAQNHG